MRGARQRRPSENVNEHKDKRSFGLREDIKVSLELSFGIADLKRAQALRFTQGELKSVPPTRKNAGKMPAVQKRNAPTGSGRSFQQQYCTTTVKSPALFP